MGCKPSAEVVAKYESDTAAADLDCADVHVSSLAGNHVEGEILKDHGIVSCAVATDLEVQMGTDESMTSQADLVRARGIAKLRKLAKEKGANAVFGFSASITSGGGGAGGSLVMLAQGTAVTRVVNEVARA